MILFLIQTIEDDFDRNRLSNLYIKHHTLFLSKAKKITQDNSAAEDVVQDANPFSLSHIITLITDQKAGLGQSDKWLFFL